VSTQCAYRPVRSSELLVQYVQLLALRADLCLGFGRLVVGEPSQDGVALLLRLHRRQMAVGRGLGLLYAALRRTQVGLHLAPAVECSLERRLGVMDAPLELLDAPLGTLLLADKGEQPLLEARSRECVEQGLRRTDNRRADGHSRQTWDSYAPVITAAGQKKKKMCVGP